MKEGVGKMRVFQGKMVGTGLKFAIVVSRFNELISSRLLEGAKDYLLRHEVRHQDIDVVWVPGAWEIPLAAKECALMGIYDGVIALGAVIRGNTPHFDYVASEVAKGLAVTGLNQRVPVTFGVLTCDNLEQALERAGSKAGNRGVEAASAALEMANLLKKLRNEQGDDKDA